MKAWLKQLHIQLHASTLNNKSSNDVSLSGVCILADEVKIIEETTTATREVVNMHYGDEDEDKKPIKLVKKNDSVRKWRGF